MKIQTLIIEDSKMDFELLKHILLKYPEINVVSTTTNKSDALIAIKEHKPDLIITDILLNGKNTTFEILDECNDFYKFVIFTTGHKDFVLKGYDYRVLHYLIKPIEETQLAKAIERVKNMLF